MEEVELLVAGGQFPPIGILRLSEGLVRPFVLDSLDMAGCRFLFLYTDKTDMRATHTTTPAQIVWTL